MPSYWPLLVLIAFAGLLFVVISLAADKREEKLKRKEAENETENLKKQRDTTVDRSKSPAEWMRKWKR